MSDSISIGCAYRDQAIVGGAVDNTPVGATTASTVAATTLSSTSTTNIGSGGASTLIGFHGVPAVDQAAYVASVTSVYLEGSISASAIVGFSVGSFSVFMTEFRALKAAFIEKGFMASA